MINKFLHWRNLDLGLLILRVLVGGFMLFGHGWGKLMAFGEKFHTWADPLGVGHELSYILTVGAEVFCSLLLILGLVTRFAVIPLVITMLVIILIVHGDDDWHKKEFALLYLIPYMALLFSGPGKYSMDHLIFWKDK